MKATVDPIFIREKSTENAIVKKTAKIRGQCPRTRLGSESIRINSPFSGISKRGDTVANHLWNGTPPSRANAKSWRDAVVIFVIPFATAESTRMQDMAVAPPLDPVAL